MKRNNEHPILFLFFVYNKLNVNELYGNWIEYIIHNGLQIRKKNENNITC